MGIIGLNLPTDIKWERFCVTQDMMAKGTCEHDHPSNFSSSMALFKYIPEDEYQVYADRKIVYLKLVCTITGYQPKDIEGEIVWGGVHGAPKDHIDDLLNSYKPCTGALLQITVGPPRGKVVDAKNYPYIMDFQPKTRELYEMATDSNEKMSRSSNSLAVGKSATTTTSQEILDVDTGRSFSSAANVSVAGYGAGGSSSQSLTGEWGTKDLSNQQSGLSRSTDESRERREVQSHTTQITNMYHLLDSYHLGTNRALFFIQPRPHVLEISTGFVNGPRGIEGIQEFFFVINQPKNLDDICVSVRLDTGHYFTGDRLDYDTSKTDKDIYSANVNAPMQGETGDNIVNQGSATVMYEDANGEIPMQIGCATKTDIRKETYHSPWADYKIDVNNNNGYVILPTSKYDHGSVNVSVSPDGESLEVTSSAASHGCYGDPSGLSAFLSAEVYNASSNTDLQINLISRDKIVKVGEQHSMFIVTRGLCCCPLPETHQPSIPGSVTPTHGVFQEGIVDVINLAVMYNEPVAEKQRQRLILSNRPPSVNMDIRDANALSNAMRSRMLSSITSRRRSKPGTESTHALNFIQDNLFNRMIQTAAGRHLISTKCTDFISPEISRKITKWFKRDIDKITRRDLLLLDTQQLSKITGLDEASVTRLKLILLGVPTGKVPTEPKKEKPSHESQEKHHYDKVQNEEHKSHKK